MSEQIPFTKEHETMLQEIHEAITEFRKEVHNFLPQAESMLKSGPLAMIAGSFLKRP